MKKKHAWYGSNQRLRDFWLDAVPTEPQCQRGITKRFNNFKLQWNCLPSLNLSTSAHRLNLILLGLNLYDTMLLVFLIGINCIIISVKNVIIENGGKVNF